VMIESEIDKNGPFAGYLTLDRDDWIRRLHIMTDTVHRYGAKIAIELAAGAGRAAHKPPGVQPVGPSAMPPLTNSELPIRELTVSEIQRLTEAYGQAAVRAQKAGFDAIHFHCKETLFDYFLTPYCNRRRDIYGGDVDGRMRFILDCIDCVKSELGSNFPLIVGMASSHKVPDDYSPEEAVYIAQRFESAGIHALHVRAGSSEAIEWVLPPMYMEDGCSLDVAQPIKRAVSIPVIVSGKIRTPELAERILESGQADFIGIARPILADPEWPNKARYGQTTDIRQCIACNECLWRIHQWAPLGCTVNPKLGREEDCDIKPAANPKSVLVIGGGPAGMEAARVAALRGHRVSLIERDDQLGGHLIDASVPLFKKDIRTLLLQLISQLTDLKVNVELNKEVTAQLVAQLKPQVVIVAAGSRPDIPDIPGVNGNNVATAIDVLRGRVKLGQRVVVVGGNQTGAEVALYMAQMGKTVTIIRRGPEAMPPDMPVFNQALIVKLLAEQGVTWITNVDVREITSEGVVLVNRETASEQLIKADSIVLARGLVSNRQLYDELENAVPEIYAIGDSVAPRKIWEAIHEGFHIGREI